MHPEECRTPSIFYWSEDTAGKRFDNGVQRVVRCLGHALRDLGIAVVPIGWDETRRAIRVLSAAEQAGVQLGGSVAEAPFRPLADDWLFVAEIPEQMMARGTDPIRLGRAYGLRTAALVHDLIPLKHPHVYAPTVLAFYHRYFRIFAETDVTVATTRYVADDLHRHLEGGRRPEIAVCPLAAQMPGVPRRLRKPPLPDAALRLLTVSRWEPRKNLPRLLGALEMLASQPASRPIHLTVVGRRGGFPDYEADVDARLARLPNVTARHDVGDAELVALYETHHASIYPSYEEGFGLPILESLWLATPCLCHAGSAMAENAPGGGTILVEMQDEAAIAAALAHLAGAPDLVSTLADEAAARPLRTWADTAHDVATAFGLAEAAAVNP